MFYIFWKRVLHIPLRFQRVVENDDASPAGISDGCLQHFLRATFAIVIVRYHVPKYNAVSLAKFSQLRATHDAVRRTKQIALDDPGCLFHVFHIRVAMSVNALQMVIGMIARLVSATQKLLINVGILIDILAHTEKSCLNLVLIEEVQHPRRNLRYRTIVECKINRLLFVCKTPSDA